MTTTDLSEDAKKLSDLANENLGLLTGICQEAIEIQDYYLGLIRKQAILLLDLSLILKNRNSEYISTPFILLRSLIDDFIHLLYLEHHIEKKTEITKINADSYKQSFKSLEDLTDSNYEHFDGKYDFYLSQEELQSVKDTFLRREKNKKYFKNAAEFSFIKFMHFSDMAKSFSISRNVDIYRDRAFYLWKEFSSFVHYSNYSFEYENQNAPENINKIDESLQYCYNSIYLAFKYFERNMGLEFLDNVELREKYGIIHEC
jgi:hypothetical protein